MNGRHLAMATVLVVVLTLCMAPIAASDIVAPGPGGDPPGGGPGGGGSGGGSSSSSITWSGATEITTATTVGSETCTSTTANQNALLVNGDGIAVTIGTISASKTGDSDGGDNCNFYGINSAVTAKGGATLYINGGTVTADAKGANGVFSYGGNGGQNGVAGDGTTIHITGVTITTTGDNAGGIMTTGGGVTYATDLTVTTSGQSSAALRTDRGGGTVTATGGTYTSNGLGSPAIYCTAAITCENAEFVSNLSEGVCIEGLNSVTLNGCSLTASNTQRNGNATFLDTIMIYQSMSGDSSSGTSSFTMTGGTLTSNSGHVFHVTNTDAVITLSGVTIVNNDSAGILLSVCDDGWSGASNIATLNASGQTLSGTILVGSDSTLTMSLADSSAFTGTFSGSISNASGGTVSSSLGTVSMTLDSTSTWTLTADTYIGSFSGNAANVYTNGHTLYVNGTALSGTSSGTAPSSSEDNTEYTVTFPSDLTVTASGSTIASGSKVASGTVLTVTAADRTGYTASVSPSLANETYTVTGDVTFTVTYTANSSGTTQFTVTYADGITVTANGVSVSSGSKVDSGTVLTVTAADRTGYRYAISPALSDGTYTVTSDVSFTVSYSSLDSSDDDDDSNIAMYAAIAVIVIMAICAVVLFVNRRP